MSTRTRADIQKTLDDMASTQARLARLPTVSESGRRRVGSYLGAQVLYNFDQMRFELWNRAEGNPEAELRSGNGFLVFMNALDDATVKEQGWERPL